MAPESAVIEDEIVDTESWVSTAELERQITTHAGHMAAAEARWLGWLGQWCVREGWASWGCTGPVQWLSWQCGMSPSTGREKVRVALALRELPTIAKGLSQGRLSYSKVRALTRVATAANEHDLAELAIAATGAQLDTIVRTYKNAQAADDRVTKAWRDRQWTSRSHGPDCTVFTLRVTNDHAEHVREAVAAETERVIAESIGIHGRMSRDDVLEQRCGYRAVAADAALALLNGTARTNDVLPTEVEIVVNDGDHTNHACTASAEAVADTNLAAQDQVASEVPDPTDAAAVPGTPAETVADSNGAALGKAGRSPLEYTVAGQPVAKQIGERLCCDPRIAVLVEDAMGTVLGAGRKTRVISRKLRRALERRDQGACRFPGCCSTRRLHAHHIVHWANGGPTELENLVLLCSFHHHAMHEGGWSMAPRNGDAATFDFMKPDGTVVDLVPTQRFRGSANETTTAALLGSDAPLAEAENEPYDLGLVLESLAYDEAEAQANYEAALRRCRADRPRSYGPPIPRLMAEDRERANAINRFRGSVSTTQDQSGSQPQMA